MKLGSTGVAMRAVAPREYIRERLSSTPFVPHPRLRNQHAQTILGSVLPRKAEAVRATSRERTFQTTPDTQVVARCHWQTCLGNTEKPVNTLPTLLVSHGMEGSVESSYMLGIAEKALRAGFNVIRLNTRNCGDTERLTPTLYNAGLTEDIRQVAEELHEVDGITDLYLVGVSLSGNMTLKLAGEYGAAAPHHVRGVAVISPAVDLASSADALEKGSNWVYQRRFTNSLKRRLKRKAELFPERFNAEKLAEVKSVRQFDDAYTATHAGYLDSQDYYHRASALRIIDKVKLPTLVIHAQDDPFIPHDPLLAPEVVNNPSIAVLLPERGGHVGFLGEPRPDEDNRWAENRVIDFVKAMHATRR